MWVGKHDPVAGAQRPRQVTTRQIEALQVIEDARQDLPLRRWLEQGRPHLHLTAVHLAQHLRAFLTGQRAAVEGVDEDLATRGRGVLHQEMAGHANASYRQTGSLPYGYVQH